MTMFGKGSRELQDRYEGRAVADRIVQNVEKPVISDEYRAAIETAEFFFLATSTGDITDCSYKGGPPGFVRITGPDELIFPDYDGNRMYKSLGNIVDNPNVGMLFVRFDGDSSEDARFLRVRINGQASVHDEHEALASFPGAKRIVRVKTQHVYLNCPRYIPQMTRVSPSRYIPQEGTEAPEPKWKQRPEYADLLATEKTRNPGD